MTGYLPTISLKAYGKNSIQSCTLPLLHNDTLDILRSCPQYSALDFSNLMRRSEPHRLILFCEDDFYPIQLSSILSASRSPNPLLRRGNDLLVIPPRLLEPDPTKTQTEPERNLLAPAQSKLFVADTPILIAAPDGPILTETLLHELRLLLDSRDDGLSDIYIALKSSQQNANLCEELCFRYGFEVCILKSATFLYLCGVLEQTLKNRRMELDSSLDIRTAVKTIQKFRGSAFNETDLVTAVKQAATKNCTGIITSDQLIPSIPKESEGGLEKLDQMIGLSSIKDRLQRIVACIRLEHQIDSGHRPSCRNLAFSGPPGTGKSVTARLYAQSLREIGCGTGTFVEVGRENLVGKCVGHTSPNIEKLFHDNRGGVIFIDEAGALISDERDSFGIEAVNALVRHMELCPETTVIFATYPEEMKHLLNSNPGLSSRISRTIEFTPYTDEELWEITRYTAQALHLSICEEAHSICLNFFRTLRQRKREGFGNGRESRLLVEAAKEELALRYSNSSTSELILTSQDLSLAAQTILDSYPPQPVKRTIGFTCATT